MRVVGAGLKPPLIPIPIKCVTCKYTFDTDAALWAHLRDNHKALSDV